ncbi:glycosyl transferase family 1 [Streptomyces sp. NPDC004726]
MSQRAPSVRLVVLTTDGDVTDATRPGRTALAAARAGWDVTLLTFTAGQKTAGQKAERSALGPVAVVRVPVGTALRTQAALTRRGHRLRRVFTQAGFPDRAAFDRSRAAHQAWMRAVAAAEDGTGSTFKGVGRAWIRIRRSTHGFRVRMFRWEERRDRASTDARGDWRTDWPVLLDQDLALGPVLEKLRPAVIHVVGAGLLATASISAARLRAAGVPTRWVYDAVPADGGSGALEPAAAEALVREFSGRADAVTEAVPGLARGLDPLLVREAPIAPVPADGQPLPALRDLCGLHGAGPLWVWSADHGPMLFPMAVVDALTELSDHHLAVLGDRGDASVKELLRLAEEAGVRGRVHLPAPPGSEPERLRAYLASADVALVSPVTAPPTAPELDLLTAVYGLAGLRTVTVGERPRDLAKSLVETIGAGPVSAHTWEENVAPLLDLFAELAGRPTLVPSQPTGEARPRRPLPTWAPLTRDTPVRLGLGPANYAGQLASFAHAVCRSRPDVSAQVMMATSPGTFNYPADVYLDSSKLGRLTIQLEQVERVFRNSTHFIADAFLPLLGRLNGSHVEGDLPALLRTSIKVALLAHGSEVRHPGRHMERHPDSLFHDAPEGVVERLTATAERNRAVVERFGLPTFVTTPDLLVDLPTAVWAPLVVNVDAFACDRPVLERARPVVLHAPSKRWTKGTDRALPLLNELHDRGVIEFQLAEQVDWTEMRERVRNADIVIDQFAIGSYGTFACEGMAAGKPVMAYVAEEVRERCAPDLPIVNTTTATLRETLQRLLDDRAAAAEVGARSAEFARKYHDGTKTAEVLSEFLT